MLEGPYQPLWRERTGFSALTDAKTEVKRLHRENPGETFAVRHPDGKLSDWAYDLPLSQRRDKFHDLVGMAVIALLLCPPAYAVLSFVGAKDRSLPIPIALASGCSYLLLGFLYNRIESFVIWLMLFVIFACIYARLT